MIRRLLVAVVLVFTACSSGDKPAQTLPPLSDATPAPGETMAPDAGATADPVTGATPAPAGVTAKPTVAPTAPPPPPPAPAGKFNAPRTGDYLYSLEGESSSPFQPNPQPYPQGKETKINVTAQGDIYAFKSTGDSGSQTLRLKYEANRVLLLSLELSLPGQTLRCDYNPPFEVAKLPLAPGAYPTQQSSGNNCSAKVDVRVEGQETVNVPAGSFKTWKVYQRIEFAFGNTLNGVVEGFSWISPDLGTNVQADQNTDATYQGSRITSHDVIRLKTFPG